jgi:prefoldin alpha subunit
MAENDELERISSEIQFQQARGESLRTQIQDMQGTILELTGAIEAIENLKKAKGDTLVPIGAGTFISCPKPDAEKVIISVGSGMLVQKKPEEATKMLEERRERVSKNMESLQASLSDVVRSIEEISRQASMLAASEERRNVRASEKQAD